MNTRKLSDKQEKRLAKNIGGRQVVGSGSTPFLKGDVTTSDLFIEAKTKAVKVGIAFGILLSGFMVMVLNTQRFTTLTGARLKILPLSILSGK